MKITRTIFLGGIASLALGGAALAADRYEIAYSDDEWRRRLGVARFVILRQGGTEPPFSSPLDYEKRPGTYTCAGCELALFSSKTKFDSGTGWPSFYAPLRNAVRTTKDTTWGMTRTEVHCRRCGGHLGHVFDDGPKPTGLRYCIDGLALNFKPA